MNQQMSMTQIRKIFYKLLQAIYACKKFGIIHRDIKPGNILICLKEENDFEVKLCDFGLARDLATSYS